MNLITLTEAGSFRKERNSETDTSVWISRSLTIKTRCCCSENHLPAQQRLCRRRFCCLVPHVLPTPRMMKMAHRQPERYHLKRPTGIPTHDRYLFLVGSIPLLSPRTKWQVVRGIPSTSGSTTLSVSSSEGHV